MDWADDQFDAFVKSRQPATSPLLPSGSTASISSNDVPPTGPSGITLLPRSVVEQTGSSNVPPIEEVLAATRQLWEHALRPSTSDDEGMLTGRLIECFERTCVGHGTAAIATNQITSSWDYEKVVRPQLRRVGIDSELSATDPAQICLYHRYLPSNEASVIAIKKEVIAQNLNIPAAHLNATLRLEMTTHFKMKPTANNLDAAAATTRWNQFVSRYGGHPMCRPVLFTLYRLVVLQKKITSSAPDGTATGSGRVARWRVDNHVLSLTAGPHFTRDLIVVAASIGLVPYPWSSAWDYNTMKGADSQAFIFRSGNAEVKPTSAFLQSVWTAMNKTNPMLTKNVDEEPLVGKVDYVEEPEGFCDVQTFEEEEDGGGVDSDHLESGGSGGRLGRRRRGGIVTSVIKACGGCCCVQ